MKYLRRRRVSSRAGRIRFRSASISARGPAPPRVTTPGVPWTLGIAASTAGTVVSPSPLTTQSRAPPACRSTSSATKLTLCPPASTKQSGSRSLARRAKSIASGMLAR